MIHHRKKNCAKWALTGLLVCLPVTMAFAAEGIIYKSTDAAGHVFYGDDPLPGAVKVDIIRVRSTASLDKDAAATQNAALEQLAATTKRLQDDRKDREKERLEAAQRQQEAAAQYYTTAPPVALNRPYYDVPYHPVGYYPPGYYGREYHQDVHYGANWGSSKWRIGVYYGGDHAHGHDDHGYGGQHRSEHGHGAGHGDHHLRPPMRQPRSHQAPGRFE